MSTFQAVKRGLMVRAVESNKDWYQKLSKIFPSECDVRINLVPNSYTSSTTTFEREISAY